MTIRDWQSSNVSEFWRGSATGHHLLQVYENESVFLNSLEGFAGTGLLDGDSVVVVASSSHLHALNERLKLQGFDLVDLQLNGRYQPVDADELLSKFMKNEVVEDTRFHKALKPVHDKAAAASKKVRVFGEMVALLALKGNAAAATRLELLWNDFMVAHPITLFCAYPREVMMSTNGSFIENICACHSSMISGAPHAPTEVLHKATS
jgi:hypothetical protein